MDAVETKQFETREEIMERLKEKRDLSGADMSGLDLSGMKFVALEMAGADLHDADLTGAVLAGADMSDVNFANANLANARIGGAKPRIAGVEIDADRVGIAQSVHQGLDAVDAIGDGSMLFEQESAAVAQASSSARAQSGSMQTRKSMQPLSMQSVKPSPSLSRPSLQAGFEFSARGQPVAPMQLKSPQSAKQSPSLSMPSPQRSPLSCSPVGIGTQSPASRGGAPVSLAGPESVGVPVSVTVPESSGGRVGSSGQPLSTKARARSEENIPKRMKKVLRGPMAEMMGDSFLEGPTQGRWSGVLPPEVIMATRRR